jgi:hypothetical protein
MLPYYQIVILTDHDADENKALALKYPYQADWYNYLANQILYGDQNDRFITSSRTIPTVYEINGKSTSFDIHYIAAEGIDLLPGFEAEAGSCFEASINNDWVYSNSDPVGFTQTCHCNNDFPFSADPLLKSSLVSSTLKSQNVDITMPIDTTLPIVPIKAIQTEDISISIAPNPNNGMFSIQLKGSFNNAFSVTVYNLLGENVYSTVSQYSKALQISLPVTGVYTAVITVGSKVYRKKIICN